MYPQFYWDGLPAQQIPTFWYSFFLLKKAYFYLGLGPTLLSMEITISNFCPWNSHGNPNFCPCHGHGDSIGRSSEFGIPNAKSCFFGLFSAILNSELMSIELPRNQSRVEFQYSEFIDYRHVFGIPDFELLSLKLTWAEVRN